MQKRYLWGILFAILVVTTGCSNQPMTSTNDPLAYDNTPQASEQQSQAMEDNSRLTTEQRGNASSQQTPPKQQQPQPTPQKPAGQNPPTDNTELINKYEAAVIKTNLGNMKVTFHGTESPLTVGNFLKLANDKFYDGTKFHRVIKGFMIQGGDPNSKDSNWNDDGQGGPGYAFKDEFNQQKLVKGSLAMANSGPNTNGSQFFIVTGESTPWLDGKHTNFGQVVEGMDVVEKIEQAETNPNDHPTQDVTIQSIELVEKKQ